MFCWRRLKVWFFVLYGWVALAAENEIFESAATEALAQKTADLCAGAQFVISTSSPVRQGRDVKGFLEMGGERKEADLCMLSVIEGQRRSWQSKNVSGSREVDLSEDMQVREETSGLGKVTCEVAGVLGVGSEKERSSEGVCRSEDEFQVVESEMEDERWSSSEEDPSSLQDSVMTLSASSVRSEGGFTSPDARALCYLKSNWRSLEFCSMLYNMRNQCSQLSAIRTWGDFQAELKEKINIFLKKSRLRKIQGDEMSDALVVLCASVSPENLSIIREVGAKEARVIERAQQRYCLILAECWCALSAVSGSVTRILKGLPCVMQARPLIDEMTERYNLPNVPKWEGEGDGSVDLQDVFSVLEIMNKVQAEQKFPGIVSQCCNALCDYDFSITNACVTKVCSIRDAMDEEEARCAIDKFVRVQLESMIAVLGALSAVSGTVTRTLKGLPCVTQVRSLLDEVTEYYRLSKAPAWEGEGGGSLELQDVLSVLGAMHKERAEQKFPGIVAQCCNALCDHEFGITEAYVRAMGSIRDAMEKEEACCAIDKLVRVQLESMVTTLCALIDASGTVKRVLKDLPCVTQARLLLDEMTERYSLTKIPAWEGEDDVSVELQDVFSVLETVHKVQAEQKFPGIVVQCCNVLCDYEFDITKSHVKKMCSIRDTMEKEEARCAVDNLVRVQLESLMALLNV